MKAKRVSNESKTSETKVNRVKGKESKPKRHESKPSETKANKVK
jgi:hypothetical protein